MVSMLTATQLLSPLLAQAGEQTFAVSWALAVFCVILGVAVAVLPAKRTSEVKRRKND